MRTNALEHVIYKIRNAPLNLWPYPHLYVQDIFPNDFYDDLLANLPPADTYQPLSGGYKSRLASNVIPEMIEPFLSEYFCREVLATFHKQFWECFPYKASAKFSREIRFIRDSESYAIGPHTDAPRKVVSGLFYLPETYLFREHGTGIYVPDDHEKTCPGGSHHKFDGFREVWRAPYVPNTAFFFWKTANSWHAVEKICEEIQRDVMLYNVYCED